MTWVSLFLLACLVPSFKWITGNGIFGSKICMFKCWYMLLTAFQKSVSWFRWMAYENVHFLCNVNIWYCPSCFHLCQSLGNCPQSHGLKFRSTDDSQMYISHLEMEESFGTCLVDWVDYWSFPLRFLGVTSKTQAVSLPATLTSASCATFPSLLMAVLPFQSLRRKALMPSLTHLSDVTSNPLLARGPSHCHLSPGWLE